MTRDTNRLLHARPVAQACACAWLRLASCANGGRLLMLLMYLGTTRASEEDAVYSEEQTHQLTVLVHSMIY